MSGEARFFEYGEVLVGLHDGVGKTASLQVCMPCCLMHACTPVLLGAGIIDRYEIRLPLAVWIPKMSDGRFLPEVVDVEPGMSAKVLAASSDVVKTTLDLFVQLSKLLQNPSDAVPILPLGTYVKFQYRCRTDALADVLTKLDGMQVHGVPEFRFAMASVLAFLLVKEGAMVTALP